MELWFSDYHTEKVKVSVKVQKQLFGLQTEFQRIDVFDSDEFGRFLSSDGSIVFSEKDEFVYDEMIVHVPMAVHPHVKKVLVIGYGLVGQGVAAAAKAAVMPRTHHFASMTVPTRRPISISSPPETGGLICFTLSVMVIPAVLSTPAPTGPLTCRVTGTPLQMPHGFCDTDRGFHARHPSDQTASLCRASPVRSRTARECGVFPS